MNQTTYNIIIATDSFKGSMTSYEAGDAIATAIKEQTPSRVTVYPVADGGEGTTEALSFGRAAVFTSMHYGNRTARRKSTSKVYHFWDRRRKNGYPRNGTGGRTYVSTGITEKST